jgi:hypothetical protein
MAIRGESVNWLQKIDDNHDRIITTCQVEMEFKKNRQNVMKESIEKFKSPNYESLKLPAFIGEQKVAKIDKAKKDLNLAVNKTKKVMSKWLDKPETHDTIYQSLQRLFQSNSSYRLDRDHSQRRLIKHKARTRFALGYPPKKKDDLTIGDSLNWEWIIECSATSGQDIILVTRDSDYFARIGNNIVLNTWLNQEFKDRVSQQRKIHVFERLSAAFKFAKIDVSAQEEKSEAIVIEVEDQEEII